MLSRNCCSASTAALLIAITANFPPNTGQTSLVKELHQGNVGIWNLNLPILSIREWSRSWKYAKPTKIEADEKNCDGGEHVLIFKEGLEPEAIDEISLEMDQFMEVSQKKLILASHRPKFCINSTEFHIA
jgi:hypothetical protein